MSGGSRYSNFLQYTNQLNVVRVESGILNATAGSTGLLIRNTDHYLESFSNGQGSVGECLQELLEHMVTH